MQQVAGSLPALKPGMTLANRYLIQGFLGGGGFGHIYLAHDLTLGHRRAIKEAAACDPQAQQQFRLEAEFLLNVHHPHLVRGYAVFEHDGRLYLVMDYVDGHTLENVAIEHIRRTRRPLTEAQVLDWMLPICEAAHVLHSQPVPIIHRDIKPANIKLSATQGAPVLIDLGLAKLYAAGTHTVGAALAFTPGYAPPEQYQASGLTDRRTDVYALGATLFYLLTGYQPVEAPARLSSQALTPPRTLNPAISPRTEAAVLKAMALDPAARQQDALELLRELQAARGALAGSAARRMALSGTWRAALSASSGRRCTACGAESPAGARFCMWCGAGTDEASAEAAESPVYALVGAKAAVRPEPASAAPPGSVRAAAPVVRGGSAGARNRASPAVVYARAPWRAPGSAASLATPGSAAASYAFTAQSSLRELALPVGVQREAWTSICALLALVSACLSLAAGLFLPGMIVFDVPALALGLWSVARQPAEAPREFRWIATAALVLGFVSLLAWLLLLFAGRA